MPPGVSPLFLGIPIIVAIIAIALSGWRKRREDTMHQQRHQQTQDRAVALNQELARRASLTAGAAQLRGAGERHQRSRGEGQIPLVVLGTAGANLLPLIGETFFRASAHSFLGPILLAEPDNATRAACLQDLPSALPSPIEVPLPLLSAGLKGATVVNAQGLERYWMADLQQATNTWLTRVRLDAKPAMLWILVSPGGSAAQGWPIIQRFKEEYDQVEVYVLLVLDHKTDRREVNIPQLLALYDRDEVNGFLILDNRSGATRFDQALAYLLPSLVVAPWIDPRPQSGFNVLPDIFRKYRVATVRASVGALPVRHLPAWDETLPELYYTDLSFCHAQAIRGIAEVLGKDALQSLPLQAAAQPHFVYVASPIRPEPDLRRLADRVRHSPIPGLTHDTTVGFSSIGYPLRPGTEEAPMTVISLVPVVGGIEAVRQYVLHDRIRSLFGDEEEPASHASVVGGNGRGE